VWGSSGCLDRNWIAGERGEKALCLKDKTTGKFHDKEGGDTGFLQRGSAGERGVKLSQSAEKGVPGGPAPIPGVGQGMPAVLYEGVDVHAHTSAGSRADLRVLPKEKRKHFWRDLKEDGEITGMGYLLTAKLSQARVTFDDRYEIFKEPRIWTRDELAASKRKRGGG